MVPRTALILLLALLNGCASGHSRAQWTNLHAAMLADEPGYAAILVADGFPPDQVSRSDESGFTLLHWAALKNDVVVGKALLDAGIDADIRTVRDRCGGCVESSLTGLTALHLAAAQEDSPVLVELLLDHGADPDAATQVGGVTALQLAAAGGGLETIDLLIQRGARIDGGNGPPALQRAAKHGHGEVVARLIERGAQVDGLSSGTTALVQAAAGGDPQAIRAILEAGAAVETRDAEGSSPAIVAASFGHADALHVLIDSGADITARNDNGLSVLHAAGGSGVRDLVMLLLDLGVDPYPSQDFPLETGFVFAVSAEKAASYSDKVRYYRIAADHYHRAAVALEEAAGTIDGRVSGIKVKNTLVTMGAHALMLGMAMGTAVATGGLIGYGLVPYNTTDTTQLEKASEELSRKADLAVQHGAECTRRMRCFEQFTDYEALKGCLANGVVDVTGIRES